MDFSANQKRAIITGASSGIGRATALAFAKAQIAVALVGRSQEKLATVVTEAKALGAEAKAYPLDLSDLDSLKTKISAIGEDFGGINILVNNAGMGYTKPLGDTPLSEWQQVLNLNLTSVFQCTQALLPTLRGNSPATIINVSSIAADNPFPDWGVYSVSKAGLVAFSKTLAVEERAHGIRVMVISPGSVNTPIWDTESVSADLNRSAMLTPNTVAETILYAVLLPSSATIDSLTIMPAQGAL